MKSIRLLAAASVLAATVALGGCDAASISAQINSTATAVEQVTATVCSYIAPFDAIISIINKNAGATAGQIGASICAALGTPPKSSRALKATSGAGLLPYSPGVVSGVLVTGGQHL